MGLLDTIAPTSRNKLLGLLADAAQGVSDFAAKPFGYNNPPGELVAGLLGVPDVAKTLDRLSYGEPLTTGKGMTLRPREEAVNAAMAALPLGATLGKGAIDAGVYAAQKAAPTIERAVPKIMESGGLTAQLLQDLALGSKSSIIEMPDSVKNFKVIDEIKKTTYPREDQILLAQKNAALPIDQGGLGLRPDNTQLERAKAISALSADDAAQRAHQVGDLNFKNIPVNEFKGKFIYKSPVYNGRQSSEYRLGSVGGEPVYMRKANHWGSFSTNIREDDQIAKSVSDLMPKTEDKYGRIGSLGNRWSMSDGPIAEKLLPLEEKRRQYPLFSKERDAIADQIFTLKKKSQAGYVPMSELIGKLPEKIAHFENNLHVPVITLPNGKARSRFAAFDPLLLDSDDFLAGVAPLGLLADEDIRKKIIAP